MKKYSLDNPYSFGVAMVDHKKLRLTVFSQEEAYICRMEKRTEIEKFLLQKEGQLFKGRLQLEMANEQVNIIAKGEAIGSITKQWLEKALGDLELVE